MPYLQQGHRIKAVQVPLAPAKALTHLHPHHPLGLQMHGENARVEILQRHAQDQQAIAAFHQIAHLSGAGGPFVEPKAETMVLIK